jgi:hypothetical protein
MPALSPFKVLLRYGCRALVILAAMLLAEAPALAQSCGNSGTAPWATCPTWTGPSWIAYIARNQGNTQAEPALGTIGINGDGISDLFYYSTSGVDIAVTSGTTFTGSSVSTPAADCYTGNFDGSGRSGIACKTGGVVYLANANSTGTGFQTFTSKRSPPPAWMREVACAG